MTAFAARLSGLPRLPASCSARLSCLLFTLLLSGVGAPLCRAQVLPILPLFNFINEARSGTDAQYRRGTYQLTNGTWREGTWAILQGNVSIVDKVDKKYGARTFGPNEVQRFVHEKDTFSIIRAFDIPEPATHIDAGFARQLYRGGGFVLSYYVHFPPGAAIAKSYMLLFHDQDKAVVVPTKPREFREFMLAYVSDYPLLANKLSSGALERKDAAQILEWYVLWKRFRPATPTPAGK